jgi:hypothetical protein
MVRSSRDRFSARFLLCRLAVLFLLLAAVPAISQQTAQFWPEIDTYIKLDPTFRLMFNASTTQEAGKTVGAQFGANFDIFTKPLVKLKRFTVFQLDESKSRPLTFRIGYNRLPTPGKPSENRVVLDATPRFPLKAGFLVTDRNRADLRWINEDFSWRYRNRLMVERTFAIHHYHFTPYVRGEAYYVSTAGKWSRTTEDIGCLFPIRRRAEIETYYEHMNDTSKAPNQQKHGFGLTLSLYF